MPVAHFVVTGEAMTEMARDLMLSEEPGKAYRLLSDCLIGPHAAEAALKVLQGTHDLDGDSSMGLELVEAADTSELAAFKKSMQFIYAGRYRSRRGWLRPAAKVMQFGPEDARWATNRVPRGTRGSAAMKRWSKERAAYYCSSDEIVELLKIEDQRAYVIWEPCSELPHWMTPPATLQDALDQALEAGRRLPERPSEAERELEQMEAREAAKEVAREKRELRRREKRKEKLEQERQAELERIGEEVRRQAGDDTFILELKDGRQLTVPRLPFVRWALRTAIGTTPPDWDNVAPSGLKMGGDNPDHTDWVLGAGLELGEAYADNVNEAAWDKAFEIQEEYREAKLPYPGIRAAMEMLSNTIHKAATIVDAGERTGTVGVDVAVFPDSEAERVEQLDGNVAVIVEKGGKLAHFAIVTKGRGITVMRHPQATELFADGVRVNLNPKTGRIVILDD